MSESTLGNAEIPVANNPYISSSRNDLLKLVAMITMFIDHLGHMGIVADPFWNTVCRTIGRIAFPIFAYQVALGYSKTSSLPKYIKRLLSFALISHIPYIIFSHDFSIHPFHFNVIFMLLFGVFSIMCYEKGQALWRENKLSSLCFFIATACIIVFPQVASPIITGILPQAPLAPLFTIGAIEVHVVYDFMFSYGSYGILMVLFFHIFKGKPVQMIIGYILLSGFGVWFGMQGLLFRNGLRYFGQQYGYLEAFFAFDRFKIFADNNDSFSNLTGFFFQCRSLLTLPFIILLERHFIKIKLNKFIGYWFYPLHITLILIIAFVLAVN